MKTLAALIVLLFAAASAQFPVFGVPGYGFPGYGFPGFGGLQDESYAASLAGAPVGLYGKKHYGGPGFGGFPGYGPGRGSDVTGASLGGAKVGLYGKNHDNPSLPQAYPVPVPLPVAVPKPGYGRPVRRPGYRPSVY